jgi:hypothetical protein
VERADRLAGSQAVMGLRARWPARSTLRMRPRHSTPSRAGGGDRRGRAYSRPKPTEQALDECARLAGEQVAPEAVAAMFSAYDAKMLAADAAVVLD